MAGLDLVSDGNVPDVVVDGCQMTYHLTPLARRLWAALLQSELAATSFSHELDGNFHRKTKLILLVFHLVQI